MKKSWFITGPPRPYRRSPRPPNFLSRKNICFHLRYRKKTFKNSKGFEGAP